MDESPARRFAALWELGSSPPDIFSFFEEEGCGTSAEFIEVVRLDQLQRSKLGSLLPVDRYLDVDHGLTLNEELIASLVLCDFQCRRKAAQNLTVEEYLQRFPGLRDSLSRAIDPGDTSAVDDSVTAIYSHQPEIDSASQQTLGYGPEPEVEASPPVIGRYQVVRSLGRGAFGKVYLARDEDLDRLVAVKIAHRERIRTADDVKAYLAEAQMLASLDHPAIVPVHDVGTTEDGRCYLVSRFIEGSDLGTRLAKAPLTHLEAAGLIATIADALHHSHREGLVHRDIKPDNILIDTSGRPWLTDFGLALKEEDVGRGPTMMGTPAYMSPEQARGEGHLVDGRSDIFSLGVTFYVLLVGKRPFRGNSTVAVLDQVKSFEPRPPRQVNDSIPIELERICLKAMAKRISERYTTAKDMSLDIQRFLEAGVAADGVPLVRSSSPDSLSRSTGSVTAQSTQRYLTVVPRGLRSFDQGDANFFLELLPGVRDQNGLPENICFWKQRIEEGDAESTFRLGLIYGPSGCGKSSLVKAGLLPQLAPHVTTIFIEATSDDTEAQLLRALRRKIPQLPSGLGLMETLTTLRRDWQRSDGRKVLIILDQFEQWLHAHRHVERTELGDALRQCDGSHLQCILLVRDDFWMAVTRFLRELDIRLAEGDNSAAVDLFDPRHARKVLMAFGRAYEALPMNASDLTDQQQQFVKEAVDGLAEDGKVISVRLALFAEMVKDKVWNPATLKSVGGARGVGATFLEETFAAPNAPPEHRLHQRAARAVLQALLPSHGTDIKGHMRSWEELLEVSGYSRRPDEFQDLIRILDKELKLLTPVDPDGNDPDRWETESSPVEGQSRCYQLAHDYLVHSLREWLTRKQRETARGRAEIRLAERADIWTARPDARHLPSYLEWLNILAFAPQRSWNDAQRKMMRTATARYSVLATAALIACLLLGWGWYEFNGANRAASLTEQLVTANVSEVRELIDRLDNSSRWSTAKLEAALAKAEAGTRRHTYISLALLRRDHSLLEDVRPQLLTADPETLVLLRDELRSHGGQLVEDLWDCLSDEAAADSKRLNAALVLASYDSPDDDNDFWREHADYVADRLVDFANEDRDSYPTTLSLVFPAREALLDRLSQVFVDESETGIRRSSATGLLADFLRADPQRLVDTFLDADVEQLKVILATLDQQQAEVHDVLKRSVGGRVDSSLAKEDRIRLAHRRAIAAALLLRHGSASDAVWDVFKNSGFADARSLLIHRVQPLGVHPQLIATRLPSETDDSIQQGLLQALGEFDPGQLPDDLVARTVQLVKGWSQKDKDAGVCSSSGWLLQRWGQEAWLANSRDQSNEISADRGRNWYVNSERHMMVSLFNDGQEQAYGFDIAANEVTMGQFRRFRPSHKLVAEQAPTLDCPVVRVNWHTAAAYCNWLTRQAGLGEDQLCYPDWKEGDPAVEMYPDYSSRTGYRLPTVDEWFIANQSGTRTPYFFGEDPARIEGYALLYSESGDRAWPAGNSKPNDYGLFDVIANVREWVSDTGSAGKRGVAGKHYGARIEWFYGRDGSPRISWDSPDLTWAYIGFRVARSRPAETKIVQ